jgi:histidyl-tRNA synthetase
MKQIQTLKGFRDFLPAEKRKRDYVASIIRRVFQHHGFEPLETPTLEYASLLLGKYGDEADKLVYTFADRGERQVALRYDQTVPTARVLSQYQHQLPKFFRRYQIQNVFRADKPQKGRYREFAQCDCDIFGTQSVVADAEILAVYYGVYQALGIDSIQLEINDRQTLLQTLSPFTSPKVDVMSLVQSIDKLDKLSPSEVVAELVTKGLAKPDAEAALSEIENAEMSINLADIVDKSVALGVPRSALVFNPKLARGLDYYTGLIFEGRIPEYTVGSVGGGGRYDQLIEQLAGPSISAVGFGIGFDRTVEAADQLGLIPVDKAPAQVLVTLFDDSTTEVSLQAAAKLRQAGIATEVYPAVDKLSKQFKLADQKQIPFVVIIGQDELDNDTITLKNMSSGDQQSLSLDKLIQTLQD